MREIELPTRFFFGIRLSDGEAGCVVTDVLPKAPADVAGLRRSDLVTMVNRAKVRSPGAFVELLRRNNAIGLQRGRRSLRLRGKAINIASQREVASLLVGKGDRVPGLGRISLFKRCNAQCRCVDGGMACEIWYSFEGNGPHGGQLMLTHCRTTAYDSTQWKTTTTDRTDPKGPKEWF